MAYLTWLAQVLRDAGCKVYEHGNWKAHGHGPMSDIRGVLLHHTAGPVNGDYPSANTVVNGRPGLDGPLAHLGLARDGYWWVIAAGQAWHAGNGSYSWCGTNNGNAHLIGIEAESTGRGDWTQEQLDAYPKGVAALLDYLGLGTERAIGHKEWAPGRKIDPHGWPGDMKGFRLEVQSIRNGEEEEDLKDDERQALFDIKNQVMKFIAGNHSTNGQWDDSKVEVQDEEGNVTTELVEKWGVLAVPPVKANLVTGPKGRSWFSMVTPDKDAEIIGIWAVADKGPGPKAGEYPLVTGKFTLTKDDRPMWELPDGVTQVSVKYKASNPIGWLLEHRSEW